MVNQALVGLYVAPMCANTRDKPHVLFYFCTQTYVHVLYFFVLHYSCCIVAMITLCIWDWNCLWDCCSNEMRANKIHNNTAAAADNASDDDDDDDDDDDEMSSVMKSEISEDTSVTQSFINDTSLTGTNSVRRRRRLGPVGSGLPSIWLSSLLLPSLRWVAAGRKGGEGRGANWMAGVDDTE